jgi:hypothetical protein
MNTGFGELFINFSASSTVSHFTPEAPGRLICVRAGTPINIMRNIRMDFFILEIKISMIQVQN